MRPNEINRALAVQRADLIRPLAAQGMTGPKIAAQLGLTRGAIAGLCMRHGISLGERKDDLPPPRPAYATATAGGCRFPLWGNEAPTHRYCGKPARGSSYCAKHHALCYRVPVAEAA